MNNLKQERWQQRFYNFNRAFLQLEKGLAIEMPNDFERQGIIKSFEFTFELSWKTLKDYLEANGVDAKFPREVYKQAFHHELIKNGAIWLEMLAKRNLLAHTYDEKMAIEAYRLIKQDYFPQLVALHAWLATEANVQTGS